MKTLVLPVERKPIEIPWDGGTLQVEELGLRLPFARKPGNLREMAASGDDAVYVTETVTLTPEAFDGFASNLLASRDWLRGKGGYYGQGRLCVEVSAPGRPYLYVDPSGGDYARYVARLSGSKLIENATASSLASQSKSALLRTSQRSTPRSPR